MMRVLRRLRAGAMARHGLTGMKFSGHGPEAAFPLSALPCWNA